MLNHPAVKLHFQLAFPACAWGAVPIPFASNGVKVMATLNIPRMGWIYAVCLGLICACQ